MTDRRFVLEFSEAIHLMIASGLTLRDSLDLAGQVLQRKRARVLVMELAVRVDRGESFAQAISAMPRVFPPVYRGMVLVGERVGTLATVFERLVTYLRQRGALRERVISALMYPMLVLALVMVLMVGLTTIILPRMELAIASLGDPGYQLAGAFARARSVGVGIAAVVSALAVAAATAAWASRRGGELAARADRAMVALPLVGPVFAGSRILQLLFALEALTAGGVPVEQALSEAGRAVGDHAINGAAHRAAERVKLGMPLSTAFAAEPVIPARIGAWVRIGERTGDVAAVFGQLRRYYQAEGERRIHRFVTLFEPALMILVGIAMIGLIVGVILPIFRAFGSLV